MKTTVRIIKIEPSYSYEYFKRRIKKLDFYKVTNEEIKEICEDIESDIESGNLTENEKIVLHKLLVLKILFNK